MSPGIRTFKASPDAVSFSITAQTLRSGRRAFLLNPPAPTSEDTDRLEHRTLESIVHALDGSGLERVVVESTYGAQRGMRIGDLSVAILFEVTLL
jgi:hypothetical protein